MSVTSSGLFRVLGQGYGCEAYGETVAYNSCETTQGTTDNSDGLLTDTGTAVVMVVTAVVFVMFIATIVKIWRKPKKNKN